MYEFILGVANALNSIPNIFYTSSILYYVGCEMIWGQDSFPLEKETYSFLMYSADSLFYINTSTSIVAFFLQINTSIYCLTKKSDYKTLETH